MRGRIHYILIKMCYSTYAKLYMSMSPHLLKQHIKFFFYIIITIKHFFYLFTYKKGTSHSTPLWELLLNCAVYCLFLTKYHTVTMGSISVRWHHPHRREHWNSSSLCAWYKWSHVCTGLNLSPTEEGWLQRRRKTCRIKEINHLRVMEVITDGMF